MGEKEISYDPDHSYYSYNEKGTYVKNGNSIYFYPSDFEEGENIVTLSTDSQTLKVGVKKKVTGTDYFGYPSGYEIERFDVTEDEPEPVETPGEIEAGGIVGNMMLKSVVLNCYSDVRINAELAEGITADIGGIAGLSKMNALVLNSAAKGEIVASSSDKVQAGRVVIKQRLVR